MDDVPLMERARAGLRELLGGNVVVTEEEDGVFAKIQLGRMCITDGAEDAFSDLYLEPSP